MDNNDELELTLSFNKELETNITNKQITALRILMNMSYKDARDIIKSGYMNMTILKEKFAHITKILDEAEITYFVNSTESCEDGQKDEQKKVNFIVSKGILNKKKDKTVECYLLSKEEYNKLFAVKATLIDIIGTLKSLVDRCQSIKD
nr:MAG TPA: hypothetical protein [Caudoviricetes sp.]